jgi:hypothetical protein
VYEGERERQKRSVIVAVVMTVVHDPVNNFGNSAAGVFVLKTMTARVEENLFGCHVVSVEDGGKNAGLGAIPCSFQICSRSARSEAE